LAHVRELASSGAAMTRQQLGEAPCDDERMRRDLLLVRHAKSAWDDPSLADHDRPLAPRGEKALRGLRDQLSRAEHRPDVVLCSSARRTVDTLDGFRAALPKQARIDVTDDLYLANADTLLTRLHGLDGKVRCAMLVGHNPGIEDLALLLVGSGDAGLRAQLTAKLPTGAVVALSFEGRWTQLGADAARVDALFMPRRPRP
jgi:phosphohistidine phosphatase